MATEQDSDAQKKLAEDLYQAVRSDDVTKVRSLLGQGADPNQQLYWSDEWAEKLPPLHWACLRGYLEIVKTLVTHGAHTEDLKDVDNWTSLHNACCSGHKDVVQYLVEKANCDISVTDDDGETPLDFATQAGHTEIADYLKSLPQQSAVTGDTDSRSDENGPPPTKKRKSGQPVTLRVCPNCEESCHIRCKKCPECEHEFPPSTKSRAKPDQDIVKNPSNLLQILQKKHSLLAKKDV
ncbi:osteoclast-stimulating factor 1-like isoform X2 [Halichondria panicea]|uniref:osteoclast-stimulating factor 1-like isoform X2 n=1 Tax=Halichondria panicea TaxID=6063 RepID=UPI00312B91B1